MKVISPLGRVSLVVLLVLSIVTVACSADKTYETKADFICGDAEAIIVTKYHKFTPKGPSQCEGQKLKLKDMKTGKSIITSSSGMPFDKVLDNTCADNYQCVKGKKQHYLVLVYSTGGNCVECEWQGILDLKGNRIAIDRNKKQKTQFANKWKTLGFPGSPELGGIDYNAIPDE
jgi:hypothetical protein